MQHKQVPVSSVRGIDNVEGVVEAIVSVTNIVDHVNDLIEPGAYRMTLKKRNPKVVWSHDTNIPVGKTLRVEELMPGDPRLPNDLAAQNAGALLVKMQFNLNTTRGRDAFYDVQFYGDEQEWSIGYSVPEGKYQVDEKSGIRYIKQLDLFEYSPVIFGAAPSTRTLSLKDDIADIDAKDEVVSQEEKAGKYDDINFTIPAGVKKQAQIGLDWSKEYNRGGTSVGKNTANYLLNNSQVSPEKARHIARYFPRHAVDLRTPANSKPGADGYPGAGLIAWKLWGGNEGWRWAQKIVDAMNRRDGVKAMPDELQAGDFVAWRASGGRAQGKIERVVRNGVIKVPNSSFEIRGEPNDPAALIRVYRKEGVSYTPTEVRVGHKFSTLTLIDDLESDTKDVYTESPEGEPSAFGNPQGLDTPAPAVEGEKPYSIQQDVPGCSGYAVVKEGESGPIPGGCHETLREAQAHMAALYAAEADKKSFEFKAEEEMVDGCPIATQDIAVNIKNRQTAIDVARYGPLNPELPNDEFWQAKADMFKTTVEIAKQSRCKNCAAFIVTTKMRDCMEKGLDAGPEATAIVEKANLGYCEIFDFKCAGDRTCDAWVTGGPITDADIKSVDAPMFRKEAGANGRIVPTHKTAVNMGRAWDNTQQFRNMKSPGTPSYYDRIFAFQNPNTKGDRKTHYNFIHHYVSSDGTPGEASWAALTNAMVVLNGGRSGTVLRGAQRRGVYNHIAAHYRDAGKEPPELKSDDFVDFVMIEKGIISKPLSPDSGLDVKAKGGPIPSHTTAVRDDERLDRSAILNTRSPEDPAYYKKIFAYHIPGTDGTRKTHYTFIHHHVGEDGRPGAAAVSELAAEMTILNGGRGGTRLRGEDRKAVYNHLAHHYRDFGKTPPELKSDEYIDNVMMHKGLIDKPLSIMENTDEQD